MATELLSGPRTFQGAEDPDGHRTYTIAHFIKAGADDGPANVMQTVGLPLPGDTWLVDDDVDVYAFFRRGMRVRIEQEMEGDTSSDPNWRRLWRVEQEASTRPSPRCQDFRVENPLLEPPKINGGFSHSTIEATHDRHGEPIVNSAHEVIRGPGVEFQKSQHKMTIQMNVATWEDVVDALAMIDHVNDDEIWGLPVRSVRLVDCPWEQLFYGNCLVYYRLTLNFESSTKVDPNGIDNVNPVSGWDRDLLDEGTKVLDGHWASTSPTRWVLATYYDEFDVAVEPNRHDPQDFIRAHDRNGNLCRIALDGFGLPAEVDVGTGTLTTRTGIGRIHVEYYPEANFLELGIPTNFNLIAD